MGFGKGDDVAESRAAIATAAVDGDVTAVGRLQRPAVPRGRGQREPAGPGLPRPPEGRHVCGEGCVPPLTSCISSQKINTKQYRIPAMNEITYKGKIYGIPEFYDVRTILVDNNVLDMAGVKLSGLNTSNWPRLLADREEARQDRQQRQGDPDRLRSEDPRVLPAVGEGERRRHPLQGRPTPHLNDPRAVAALAYAVSLINAQGGWDKFKSFRERGTSSAATTRSRRPGRRVPDGAVVLQRARRLLAEGAHHRAAVPQQEAAADQLRDRLGVGAIPLTAEPVPAMPVTAEPVPAMPSTAAPVPAMPATSTTPRLEG